MCGPSLHKGDRVEWKKSAIKKWWKFMARCAYYGAKPCLTSVQCKNCVDCGSGVCSCDGSEALGPNAKAINYDEWISVKHKMKSVKGYVVEIVPNTCCDVEHGFCCGVKWDNGWLTHNNQSELRLATPQ
ncbi:unnamed protein product [Cylicocyclus nassatus]|uniref:Uncharacterized protein n=1 Tax=Cylicocyclus nassatus TaxID=53992 RepID=A0AA36DP70_CYLNA|nr:unnamed protein product [Cylicocyclus nassatus]